jgi:hypothetical protein
LPDAPAHKWYIRRQSLSIGQIPEPAQLNATRIPQRISNKIKLFKLL